MVFKETENLGDTMQAVALSRLIGPAQGFFRDHPYPERDPNDFGVAAGFLLGPFYQNPERLLMAGVYYPAHHAPHVPWIAKCPLPIGARDPETHKHLIGRRVRSEFLGCVTLTLPRYDGPRSGELSVDADGPGEKLSHFIPKALPFAEEWDLALACLDRYRKASVVHTTRIHVALPCAALGTPVRYLGPKDGRTSVLDAVGIKHGEESVVDTSEFRERYADFLVRHLGIKVRDGDPVRPEVPPS